MISNGAVLDGFEYETREYYSMFIIFVIFSINIVRFLLELDM